ncbi:uncharacterized protein [Antedon mediterranea]|uniref:uncharacterized protein n=1 Tax=Antedon mediterranea TaxID=105859 RepID=UPI003AF71095
MFGFETKRRKPNMTVVGVLVCEFLLIMNVIRVCHMAPAGKVNTRFLATIKDGFCPETPGMYYFIEECVEVGLQPQCKFDMDCGGYMKCCQHTKCFDTYVCTTPLSAQDLFPSFPFFRPGRCYNVDELMKKLGGICTEQASCFEDLDCPDEDKCCFVDSNCGQIKQCYKSIPNCNVRGMTYGMGQTYYRGCLACECKMVNGDAVMECIEVADNCVNGAVIDTNPINNGQYYNEEGHIIVNGIQAMHMGIQKKYGD